VISHPGDESGFGGERNGLDAGDESVVDGGGSGAARSSSGMA
jgi:hypothetical protein